MKIKRNKITGAYYESKTPWAFLAICAFIILAVVLIVGEQSGVTSLIFGTV